MPSLSLITNKRPRGGFTIVELLVALSISSFVIVGLMLLVTMTARIQKSVRAQQLALREAKTSIERLNNEVRHARAPLTLVDPNNDNWGNSVRLQRPGSATVRSFTLDAGADGDFATPADNTFVYDPDISSGGDEIVLATNCVPLDGRGIFAYRSATTPLTVQMRLGDPADDENFAQTGPGIQGSEINITVGPRN